MAGHDWFAGFMNRNPSLSICVLQATSLARSMGFNRPIVQEFFKSLAGIIERETIEAGDLWNMDEAGITTVSKPSKVVAEKGNNQVGAVTSAGRCSLVALAHAINALGNSIPPMFIFPRVHFHDHFICDLAPTGSAGSANKCGWIIEDDFFLFMQHFVKHVRLSNDRKVLLMLNKHASHLSIKIIDFARDNGVVMLTFPPHCSHKLQPLDHSIYGPLKKYASSAQDS